MKKFLAVLGTLALSVGLVGVGAMSASAWHLTVTSDVKCASTTSATITWHVANPENEVGTVTSSTNGVVPVNTTIPAKGSSDFTQAITGPGTYNLSVSVTWPSDTGQPAQKGSITVDQKDFDACYVAPKPVVTFSYSAVCGSLTLTTVSENVNANWYYGTQAIVDGTRIGSAVIKGSGTKTTVIPFAEDSHGGSVEVDVETYASTEQDILPEGWALGTKHLVTVKTDCTPAVVVPPVVTPPVTHVTPPTTEVLAHTGATTGWLVPVGGALLLLGAGLLLRRKLFV